MPRAAKPSKPRATTSKTPSSRQRTAASSLSINDTPPLDTDGAALLDKALVLKIILAKLESNKSFDWFALSSSLLPSPSAAPARPARGRGRKSKASAADGGEGGMSGTDLHELYHNTILPALKAGRALWIDDATADDLQTLQDMNASPEPEEEMEGPIALADEDENDHVLIVEAEDAGHEDEVEVEGEADGGEGDGLLLEEIIAMERAVGKKKERAKGGAPKKRATVPERVSNGHRRRKGQAGA